MTVPPSLRLLGSPTSGPRRSAGPPRSRTSPDVKGLLHAGRSMTLPDPHGERRFHSPGPTDRLPRYRRTGLSGVKRGRSTS